MLARLRLYIKGATLSAEGGFFFVALVDGYNVMTYEAYLKQIKNKRIIKLLLLN